jgi:methylphosphotriester-DNA--protein-cysteine methyltransferase
VEKKDIGGTNMARKKGTRICQRCRTFHKKEDLKMSKIGRVCEACYREQEQEYKTKRGRTI